MTLANGPGAPGDWVGLYDASGNNVSWRYLNGTQTLPATGFTTAAVTFLLPATPGTFHARFFNAQYTLIATSGTVTTTLPSVTLNTSTASVGGTITAIVANGPGIAGDWVGLYDAATGNNITWRYLNGTQVKPTVAVASASITFELPTTPGTYHVRLFNASNVLVATSGTVTTSVPTVTLGASTGTAGGPVTATVSNGPGNPGDWVGLYDDNGTVISWQYLSGSQTLPAAGVRNATVTFVLPAAPGTFHVRFFNASYVLVATSSTITTSVPTVTLDAVTGAVGGAVTATIANGPGMPGDWVGLYDSNGNAVQWWYLNASHSIPASGVTSASVPFTLPAPGTYQVRLFNGNYVLVATTGSLTVF